MEIEWIRDADEKNDFEIMRELLENEKEGLERLAER